MRFHFGWNSHFSVQPAVSLCSHELRWNETQNGMDFISVILIEMKFETGMRFSCEHNLLETKWISADSLDVLRLMRMCVWNSMPVWISYRSFWQKWNFITGNKILCKHYPKWNAYTCPSKYRVVLKCSRNETSCEQNLFSRRFEITNRYEFISPLMWTHSKYNFNNWLSKNNFQFFYKVSLPFLQKQLFASAPQAAILENLVKVIIRKKLWSCSFSIKL